MWLSLAFLSAALLGLYDVAKKYSLRENAVIPVLFCNTLFCALIFLPFIVASHTGILGSESLLCVDNWQWQEQRFIVLKSFIVLSSWILGYYAIKHLPITIVGPVNPTRPVLTLLGALIIFGERLNGWQWAGVLLAVTSFYMLSRSGKKEGIRFSHNRWIYYLVAAALLGTVSGLYDKFLMSPTGAGIRAITVQCWYNFYQCDNGHCASYGVVASAQGLAVPLALVDNADFSVYHPCRRRILLRSDLSRRNDFSDLHGAPRQCDSIVLLWRDDFQGEESAVESRRPLPGVAQYGVSVDRRTLRERKQMIKYIV